MSRKKNKGLDRRGKLMLLMWLGIWLVGSLWSGLHGGNGLLAAVWHGFLTMAGCMGLLFLGFLISICPEEQRRYNERIRREREEKEQRRRELLEGLNFYTDDDMDDDCPSETDLDIRMDHDVDFDITVSDPILDLTEYEEEKAHYLSLDHIDKYRLARLREFIRETVNNCDIFDDLPTLFDDPLLQKETEELV